MTYRSLAKLGALAALIGALTFGGKASALTINLGTIDSAETITKTIAYSVDELITFKFKIDAPYDFTFKDTGALTNVPFVITSTATGGSGTYTETFGKYPDGGTVNYSLMTSVPEVAPWALMLLGFAGLGVVGFRRSKSEYRDFAAI